MAEILPVADRVFDVLQLCDVEDSSGDEVVVAVEPEVLYPAMVKRIGEVLDGDPPREVMISSNPEIAPAQIARGFVKEARRLVKYLETIESGVTDDQGKRGDALELCRKWFTRALQARVREGGLRIRILNTEAAAKYRLPNGYTERPLVA